MKIVYSVILAVSVAPTCAWADDSSSSPDSTSSPVPVVATFNDAMALTAGELSASRAGKDIPADTGAQLQLNQNDLNAVFTGNVATGNHTGDNTISAGAFMDASGFVTAIQNTGNNVLIQNATIVNVSITP